MSKLTTEDLKGSLYIKVAELTPVLFRQFVDENKENKDRIMYFYFWACVPLGLILLSRIMEYSWMEVLVSIKYLVIAMPLVIIVHELLHVGTYFEAGGPKIRWFADWRKLIFRLLPDRLVLDRKDINVLAIAPFLMINTLIVMFISYAEITGIERRTALVVLFLHTLWCESDFALMSFFHKHRHTGMLMYYDAREAKMHIYQQLPVDEAYKVSK